MQSDILWFAAQFILWRRSLPRGAWAAEAAVLCVSVQSLTLTVVVNVHLPYILRNIVVTITEIANDILWVCLLHCAIRRPPPDVIKMFFGLLAVCSCSVWCMKGWATMYTLSLPPGVVPLHVTVMTWSPRGSENLLSTNNNLAPSTMRMQLSDVHAQDKEKLLM